MSPEPLRLQVGGEQNATFITCKIVIRECDIYLQTNRLHKPKPQNTMVHPATDSSQPQATLSRRHSYKVWHQEKEQNVKAGRLQKKRTEEAPHFPTH